MVAIAGSAGAVGAIREILSQLPRDFPAPVLYLQHAPAPRTSKLVDVMQSCTGLKVRWAKDGQPIQKGVTICPPGYSFMVDAEGCIELRELQNMADMQRSADRFFSSVAQRYAHRMVSILLSGAGGDGGQGAAVVRARGGIVMVQDEASALIWDMPRAALNLGGVDLVVPLRNIAPTLVNLVRDRHTLADVSEMATFAESPDDFITDEFRVALQWRLTRMCQVHGTDRGSIQLFDPDTGTLRIVVQAGFGLDFLHHFERVHPQDGSSCGRAMNGHMPVIIRDIELERSFEPHRAIARTAGFRSVQSTPLIGPRGILMGVASTHFRTRQWTMEGKLHSDEWRTQCNVAIMQISDALKLW
jgi:hypothetical protein